MWRVYPGPVFNTWAEVPSFLEAMTPEYVFVILLNFFVSLKAIRWFLYCLCVCRKADKMQERIQNWYKEFKQLSKQMVQYQVKHALQTVADKPVDLPWVDIDVENREVMED